MHFIVKATIPVEAGNKLVRSGPKMEELMTKVLGDVRPEAAYFAADKGQRTIYLVVNLAESQEMVRIAEPLWLAFNADVEAVPVMNQEEFAKAAPILGSVVPKY